MKKNTLILFFLFCASCCPERSSAQSPYLWKSVIVGGGGFVPGILYHPKQRELLYARTDIGGAYRWDHTLAKWIPLTDMMDRTNSDYMGILSIALDPNDTNRIYMECGKYTQSWAELGAVLSSTDKGNSWTIHPLSIKIGSNEDGRGAGERLQVDPNLNSILLMGTTKNGLWKSTNYGTAWEQISSFSPRNINFVLFDPLNSSLGKPTSRLFAAAVDTNGQSLYRSDDGGYSWFLLPGQPKGVMAIRAEIADTLLIITFANSQGPNGATAGSVWKYNISNGTWTNISPSSGPFGFSGISVYHTNPNYMVVSTLDRWKLEDEIYLSTDGGNSWSPRLSTATLDHGYAPYTSRNIKPHWIATVAMDPFDSSKVMFGTGYGIWATDNFCSAAPTWYFKDQNLEETVPMQIINPPYTCLISAMGDYDGFKHDSLDVSPPDRHFPYRWTTMSIAFAEKAPSKLIKAFNRIPYGAYSTDEGKAWIDFNSSPSGATAGGTWSITISADGNTIVWGPLGSLMSVSSDNGNTWTTSKGEVPSVPPVADRVNPNKFYAYNGADGQLWVSTDKGRTFTKGLHGLPIWTKWSPQDANVTAVPGFEGDLWICCASGGLYRSTNSGTSAERITFVTEAYRIGFGKSLNAGGYLAIYLYGIVDNSLGFFRSDDAGASWTRINDDNHQFGWVHQITGDSRVYGRCYISAEGRGIIFGQPENK
ncbi:MAG: endoglucanase [Bacteroidota bacterium]